MDESTDVGFRRRPAWCLILLILLSAQAALTLRLFGSEDALDHIQSDEPLVGGRHPLHLYHGSVGATNWLARGNPVGYDPSFQAGYPKTPVFEGGCRLAELFLICGGGDALSAYKWGLAAACFFLPIGFVLAARGFDLSPGASCCAAALGGTLGWLPPLRGLIEQGDIDLYFGGIALLVHLGWLVRYGRNASPGSWLMLTLSACFAWYLMPLPSIALLPVMLVYYLWVGGHRGAVWHLAFIGGATLVVCVNLIWMWDWARYSWIFVPGNPPSSNFFDIDLLTAAAMLAIPVEPIPQGISALAVFGIVAMTARGQSGPAALTIGAGLVILYTASAANNWPPLKDLGADQLLTILPWMTVLPAAYLLTELAKGLGAAAGWRPMGALWLVAGLGGLGYGIGIPAYLLGQPPLPLGLTPQRQQIVKFLAEKSNPRGRILWEETVGRDTANWTPLLPHLTQRDYLGGLDPTGHIEHLYARLQEGRLAKRPMAEWTNDELDRFFRRYNVACIVTWTQPSVDRLRQYPAAVQIAQFQDGERTGLFFALKRQPNLFLKGSGRVVQVDRERIALADVVPENGEVVLSLHYQSGWHIAPNFVMLERELDPYDPIPMMRLRMPSGVARLTLTWDRD